MTHLARLLAPLSLTLLFLVPATAEAILGPPGFVIENALPNVGFNQPTAFAFTPDGRILVAEKRGVVRVVQNGVKLADPMWSGEAEVLNNGDRGFIGIAVDPNYAVNRYVYFLYTADPDSNNADVNDDAFGRLTRYRTRIDDPNRVDPETRTVLIGQTWSDGFASGSYSHSVGDLQWGTDGSLFVSCGEGAQYSRADSGGRDPGLFGEGRIDPDQDIGAFRAQYLGSLGGKLLRIDPETGAGYPNNPYFDGDPRSARSRVWAYGLRNPFRLSLRPQTGCADPAAGDPGIVYIHDCGWRDFEELDVAFGGENFGWPCTEGPLSQPAYAFLEPTHHGCSSIGTFENPAPITLPVVTWAQTDTAHSIPFGLKGSCTGGGAFYAAQAYPPAYRGRLFFADFGKNWIKVAAFDGLQRLIDVQPFAELAEGPVFFAPDPVNGDILFLALLTGRIYRIRYMTPDGANAPPVAVAETERDAGTMPFVAYFSSTGSFDPDFESLSVHWSFGDGTECPYPNPAHTYTTAGEYTVVLTVEDGKGGVDRDTVVVRAESPLGVAESGGGLSLSGCFPNPMRSRTAVLLALPAAGPVDFSIHDVQGRAVWESSRWCAAGPHRLEWNGEVRGGGRARPGVYLVRVGAAGRTLTRRVAVFR